jgi:hypothetical protein
MTTYLIAWRKVTPVGPQRDMIRCPTWQHALRHIKALEASGITVTDVIYL